MTNQDEILQDLSLARSLYLKAGALVDEAINKAKTHTYSEPVAEKLREAKHALASPLSVIFNAHLCLTDRRAKKNQAAPKHDLKPSTETERLTAQESSDTK